MSPDTLPSLNAFRSYAYWLHTRWPAGHVERLPEVRQDLSCALPGVYVCGDLVGVPLLKIALDTGARAARAAAESLGRAVAKPPSDARVDVAILGAGVAGLAAAVEAQRLGLSYRLIESAGPLSTLEDFPREKRIFTYPSGLKPAGTLRAEGEVKEALIASFRAQMEAAKVHVEPARAERLSRRGDSVRVHLANGGALDARRAIVAIGRSGEYRKLGVPGEAEALGERVFHRLHDPKDHAGKRVLVVGGGDSAVEAAIALAESGAAVTLSYRRAELTRPKPENVARLDALVAQPGTSATPRIHAADGDPAVLEGLGRVEEGTVVTLFSSTVTAVEAEHVLLDVEGRTRRIPNDLVFSMIGREAPLGFFRRSGIPIVGELRTQSWIAMAAFLAFCVALYNWKSGGALSEAFAARGWFPFNLPQLSSARDGWLAPVLGGGFFGSVDDPSTLLGTLAISAAGPAFWYTLGYSSIVVIFGLRRIRRRKTPYITAQTSVLMAVQVVPLFLLPEVILPLLHHTGTLPVGLADALFPVVEYGHGRELWRAYGLTLAWPLNVYNVFTHDPLGWWLALCAVQTFVLIPAGIWFFGKGFYCGWICSCGALAETLGDTQRHKMPHGPSWNRLNLAGQLILALAFLLLVARIAGWALPDGNVFARGFTGALEGYKWGIDVFLAGIIGVGLYFWFSGRVWCRFFCPLAALMHVYTRFSRYRIFADKKRCISCNVCTTVCHQGIDVMSFANKGLPMEDPQCVRCSACVQSCPTGVLSFGRYGAEGEVLYDRLAASPVRMREG